MFECCSTTVPRQPRTLKEESNAEETFAISANSGNSRKFDAAKYSIFENSRKVYSREKSFFISRKLIPICFLL